MVFKGLHLPIPKSQKRLISKQLHIYARTKEKIQNVIGDVCIKEKYQVVVISIKCLRYGLGGQAYHRDYA